MTSNISHSITTWFDKTQVHIHNWRSILIGYRLWESLTWYNISLDLIQHKSTVLIQHKNNLDITHKTRLDITHKLYNTTSPPQSYDDTEDLIWLPSLTWYYSQVQRMTTDAIQSTWSLLTTSTEQMQSHLNYLWELQEPSFCSDEGDSITHKFREWLLMLYNQHEAS